MPQRKSGIKELRINKRRKLRNLQVKTNLKKTLKSFRSLLGQEKPEEAKDSLKDVYKKIDKAAKRKLMSKNTAARRKSKFSRLLKSKA